MRPDFFRALAGSLLLLLLGACNDYPESPEAVTRDFMRALEVKDFALATRYVDPSLRDDFTHRIADELAELPRPPHPQELVISSTVNGERAEVQFDNWTRDAELQLVRINEQWLITK